MKYFVIRCLSCILVGLCFAAYANLQDSGIVRFIPLVLSVGVIELYAWAAYKNRR